MKDARYENWLTSQGHSFRYAESIPISKIDITKSLRNQSRFHSTFDKDRVTRYGLAMLEGDEFPAIIVVVVAGLYRIITGNHRVASAMEADRATIDAYVVETDNDQEIDILTRTANTVEGVMQTTEQDIAGAIHVMRQWKLPQSIVAKRFKIRPERISNAVILEKVDGILVSNGVSPESITQESIRRKLNVLSSDEDVLVKAAEAISVRKLDNKEASLFIDKVKSAPHHREKLSLINEELSMPKRTSVRCLSKGQRAQSAPADQILHAASFLANLIQRYCDMNGLLRNQAERERLATMADCISDGLGRIVKNSSGGV